MTQNVFIVFYTRVENKYPKKTFKIICHIILLLYYSIRFEQFKEMLFFIHVSIVFNC